MVNRTTDPGVVVGTFELVVIVSTATGTVAVQDGSVLPAAQLLPGVGRGDRAGQDLVPGVGVVHRDRERDRRGRARRARFPVQVRFGLVNDTLPAVAAASLL